MAPPSSSRALGTATVPAYAGPAASAAGEQQNTPDDTNKIKVTASQVLELARQQVGTSENAQGGGTKFQQWYARSPRAMETVGVTAATLRLPERRLVRDVRLLGRRADRRPPPGRLGRLHRDARPVVPQQRPLGHHPQARRGRLLRLERQQDLSSIQHVGFVVKDNNNGTISTIEGNTGNGAVEERVRPKSQVVGYGYPEYAA